MLHEPLSMSRYKGANEKSIVDSIVGLPNSIRAPELHNIAYHGKHAEHVFIKDFPYHSQEAFDELLTHDFIHTFLVRDPYETILSWQNINPEFQESELGYTELLHSIRKTKQISPAKVFVINSNSLLTDAPDIMRRYCHYVGLPFLTSMYLWPKREKISAWNTWERYHEEAQQSVGFLDNKRAKAPLTERNQGLYKKATRIYELILAELDQTL